MLRRSLLSLLLALSLLTGLSATPQAHVWLQCRLTGQAMAAIFGGPESAVAEKRMPCCVVKAAGSGDARYRLANRSCCDLRLSTQRGPLPPALASADVHPVAPGLPAVSSIAFLPRALRAAATMAPRSQSIPRGPPLRSANLRGPPVLS
jgi:hypothetical protein